MKNVRIWFKKDDECRYISHLDLNRCVLRALHKSKIPVWHTEGFNPHPFATFPLPLSLGFRGINECMDIRLVDEISNEKLIADFNACMPAGVRAFAVTEPVMKAGKIAYARFNIKISSDELNSRKVYEALTSLLSSDEIMIEKRTKSGIKTVDLKKSIKTYELKEMFDFAELDIVLSAGSTDNANPNLIITALEKQTEKSFYADITRIDLYNSDMELFR
ncbi:MAG: TIGR03936 family radical SAM-associated protein [Ruminococcus sp.]|nr:TIGR03936 family radical SAM-associated protein [Ruminococcus sp.]